MVCGTSGLTGLLVPSPVEDQYVIETENATGRSTAEASALAKEYKQKCAMTIHVQVKKIE